MGKDGISFQPKMSTNKQIKVRTQVLCKDLRYPAVMSSNRFLCFKKSIPTKNIVLILKDVKKIKKKKAFTFISTDIIELALMFFSESFLI